MASEWYRWDNITEGWVLAAQFSFSFAAFTFIYCNLSLHGLEFINILFICSFIYAVFTF